MALQLNLLHEAQEQEKQRQRDPLKIGFMLLCTIGAVMVGYYMWQGYQTLGIKNHLGAVKHDWEKVEPRVTAAQKRATELTGIIGTTRVLDAQIDSRFLWAPLLEKVARCVAPNMQIVGLDASVNEEGKLVTVSIEGLAAAREPRGAAEDLRQLLIEQLSTTYSEAKVEFRTLEDLDTVASVAGGNLPMARYILGITFTTTAPAAAAPPAPVRQPKK